MACSVVDARLMVFVWMIAWTSMMMARDVSWSEVMSPIWVIPSSVPSCIMRIPSVPWTHSPESAVVPRVIQSAVVPRVVIPWIIVPRMVPPCRVSPCSVVVPRVPVTAPVPRTSYAVRSIEVPGVHEAVTPVVWVFINRHDCAAVFSVVFYCSGHIVRDQDCVFPVSEQIDF